MNSGGQYNFGTTDVTRTISLNNNNKKRIKELFTRVLKGQIAVSNYKIKNNTCGAHIDKVRKPLQDINLDYAHGTGHGVGYFLNVHEGPQAITRNNKIKFKRGNDSFE